ncbi:glycosyltransferase family 87 protein [Gluconacetobacter tumulisoli]|uniref:DUF2029 domain-containing protein n=1 Tax=Gluconacetobacter tumulisoli TaxID=1286189 RepID=A0A7W4K758_9PROT|nr:glycosyltransferase family 87 protein [Gluconacetobacter tumulisoli]MBB2201571.1 DUF2029 domain-containing protein [Gluconacetobacter tumulisoli]
MYAGAKGESPGSLVARLRDGAWPTPDRVHAYFRIYVAVMLAILIGYVFSVALAARSATPPAGADFVTFWSAARQAWDGHPADAYVPMLHEATTRLAFRTAASFRLPFFYPPPLLLLCLPLAALPYLAALGAWTITGLVGWMGCLRALFHDRLPILPVALSPLALLNALNGQTGFLTATCFAAGTALLRRRPMLAGMCFGALVMKPHLALAVPVVFCAACRWRAIVGAAASMATLCMLSWVAFGNAIWRSFLDHAPAARTVLTRGMLDPARMSSIFGAARVMHLPQDMSFAVQAAAAVIVLGFAWKIARRRPGAEAEGMLIIAAAPLCTPYVVDYDLVCLMIPIIWLAGRGNCTGWLPWERTILCIAYTTPLLFRTIAIDLHVPIAPMVTVLLFFAIGRRILSDDPPRRPA